MNTIFIHKIEKGNLSLLKIPVRKKTLLNFRDPADLNPLLILDRSVLLPFHFIKIIKKMSFGFFGCSLQGGIDLLYLTNTICRGRFNLFCPMPENFLYVRRI